MRLTDWSLASVTPHNVAFAKIIIVAYHSDRWLNACVQSLCARTPPDLVDILIADNGGNHQLTEAINVAEPTISVVTTPGLLSFADANNYALANGGLDAEYVCFLNQDTITREDWLGACTRLLGIDSGIGAVIPLIENYDGTAWDEAFVTCARPAPALYERVQTGATARFDDLPEFIEVPEVTAAAMVVRTEALQKAGPFDPIFGSYYEDYDLCRRIAQAGYKVGVCTRGRVGHFGGSVTTDRKAYLRRAKWIARNRVIYSARWKWNNRPLGLLRYMLVEFPWNLARSLFGRSRVPFSAFLAAHKDLIPLLPRLVSATRDRGAWRRYLKELGWPAFASRERTYDLNAVASES